MAKLKFDREQLAALLAKLPDDSAKIILVKDQGIYLMSQNEPRPANAPEVVGGGFHHTVVYAKDYDPKDGEKVWEKCRAAVGGDDFVETVDTKKEFLKVLADSEGDILVSVTQSLISVSYLPKMSEEAKAARVKLLNEWKAKANAHPVATWSPKFKSIYKKMEKELASLGAK